VVGGLGGGFLGAKSAAEAASTLAGATRAAPGVPAPTAAELDAARTANYKAAFGSGVEVAAPAMHDAYNSTLAAIAEKFQPSEAPTTFRILSQAASKYRAPEAPPLQAYDGC
jgi:hypothetical protein